MLAGGVRPAPLCPERSRRRRRRRGSLPHTEQQQQPARGGLAKLPHGDLSKRIPLCNITISSIFLPPHPLAPSETTSHSPSWLFSIRPPSLLLQQQQHRSIEAPLPFPFPNPHSGYFKRKWIHVFWVFSPSLPLSLLPPHTHIKFSHKVLRLDGRKKSEELNRICGCTEGGFDKICHLVFFFGKRFLPPHTAGTLRSVDICAIKQME